MDRKEKQVERYYKAQKHVRSLAERKELGRRSTERKSQQKSSGRRGRGDWTEDEDEADDFEVIRRAPKVRKEELQRAIAANEVPGEHERDEVELSGLVVSVAQGRVQVRFEGDDGPEEEEAVLSDGLAKTQRTSIAVGDVVDLEVRGDGSLRARAVLTRRSRLSRPDPQNPNLERVVAANVDHAVIVAAVKNPDLRHRLIDRYLIAVENGGVRPIVCANKSDLLSSAEARAAVDELLDVYRDLGVPVLFTSSKSGEGVDELRGLLEGSTVVFVGQSGVGKSSLLNALRPDLELETGRVRSGDGKGRHTTTASTLLDLGDGTRLVDTPGVRSFGLLDVDRSNLGAYFTEFQKFAEECRFRDCTHAHEPDCGVRAASEAGKLSSLRFDTYLRILESLES